MWWWLKSGRQGPKPFGIIDPAPNKIVDTLADDDGALTVLWDGDAWNVYATSVATSLVVELGGYVPWSLSTYKPDVRAQILDSRKFFVWDETNKGYALQFSEGFSLPTAGDTAIGFLLDQKIVTDSRKNTLGALFSWERSHLTHIYNAKGLAGEMEAAYGYRGVPPAVTVIAGSVHKPDGFAHWIVGCYGNTGFLRTLLRVVNIPVEREVSGGGHTTPRFHAQSVVYLSHGDDPYDALFWSMPPGPGAELLISAKTFDSWFGPAQDSVVANNYVGKPAATVAMHRPSFYLLEKYCDDLTAGSSHADGKVLASMVRYYSQAEMEAAGVWDALDQQLVAAKGCNKIWTYFFTFYPPS